MDSFEDLDRFECYIELTGQVFTSELGLLYRLDLAIWPLSHSVADYTQLHAVVV
jgi:hypothetical protein